MFIRGFLSLASGEAVSKRRCPAPLDAGIYADGYQEKGEHPRRQPPVVDRPMDRVSTFTCSTGVVKLTHCQVTPSTSEGRVVSDGSARCL